MKQTYILLLLFSLGIFACSKDNNQLESEIIILVDSKFVATPSNIYPDKSLNVKFEGDNSWTILYNNSIEGFEYEEGFEYKLLVQQKYIPNPPQDGSKYSYKLIKILDKIQSNTPTE